MMCRAFARPSVRLAAFPSVFGAAAMALRQKPPRSPGRTYRGNSLCNLALASSPVET